MSSVTNPSCTRVRLRPGYDMDEFDSHLEQLLTLASQGHSGI